MNPRSDGISSPKRSTTTELRGGGPGSTCTALIVPITAPSVAGILIVAPTRADRSPSAPSSRDTQTCEPVIVVTRPRMCSLIFVHLCYAFGAFGEQRRTPGSWVSTAGNAQGLCPCLISSLKLQIGPRGSCGWVCGKALSAFILAGTVSDYRLISDLPLL